MPAHSNDPYPAPQPPFSDEDTNPTLFVGVPPRTQQRKSTPLSALRWVAILAGIGAMIVLAGTMLMLAVVINPAEETAPITTQVTIQTEGNSYTITTAAQNVTDLLDDQAIVLENGDLISVPLDDPVRDGMIVAIDRARTVAVTVEGDTQVLRTAATTIAGVLEDAQVMLSAGDQLYVDGVLTATDDLTAPRDDVSNIMVQRATPVRIRDGDTLIDHPSKGMTVSDALFEAGIEVFQADRVSPSMTTALTDNLEIIVDRSRPLSILVDGERIDTRTSAANIGQALVEAGITLTGLDYTIPAADNAIIANTNVRVIRVEEELVTEQETVGYETLYLADAGLELDARRVSQAGQEGIIDRTFRVRYENGIEISRTLTSEIETQPVQDQIINYGTNVIIRTADTADGPIEYWRKLRVYATSYHPAALGGDNITSIGMELRKGIIGIDPDIIPYRTNMYVPGYGQGIAADTGAPRHNPYWVDLGYSDEDWVNWYWWIDIYLMPPVPENITYLLPVRSEGGPIP